MSAGKDRRVLGVLFGGVLLGALDIAIVGPALPAIQKTFAVDTRALAWVFNAYILVALIASPLLAKLSDRRGRRFVYVLCLVAFGIGSLLVAAAPVFGALILGRVVQAAGAGGLLPVAAAVVADTFPVERRGRALGLIGAVFGIAFLLGPLLGGALLRYGWQWLFLVNLPLTVMLVAAAARLLPNERARVSGRFDFAGGASLAVMLVALTLALGRVDGAQAAAGLASAASVALLLVSAAAATAFWQAEKRAPDPVLPPELFGSRQLRIVGVIAAATGLVEAGMVFLPLLSVEAFGVEPSTASFMLLPLVAALIAGSLAAGWLLDRVGAKPVIQIGLAITAIGLFLFVRRPLELAWFYAAGFSVGLGLAGLLGAPLRFVVLQEAGETRRGAGQGLLTLFLSVGRMSGAAAIGAVVATGATELEGYRYALLLLACVAAAAAVASTALRAGRRV